MPEVSTMPDEAALRVLCADLLEDGHAWLAASGGELTLGRPDQEADHVRFASAFSFAAHAYHLVGVACGLLHERDYASAVPLLRVAYESAITSVWAADSTEAARALELELLRGVRNLRTGLTETGLFDATLEQLPEPTERIAREDVNPGAIEQSRWFNRMCEALEPEPVWVYQQFRLLSSYAHPSGSVITMFAPGPDESLHATPVPVGANEYLAWWFAAGTILLHAGQALDRLDPAGRRTKVLREAGVVLGWETPLRLKVGMRKALKG